MSEQEAEQHVALLLRQSYDARGEALVDEQAPATVIESSDDGVDDGRIRGDRALPGFTPISDAPQVTPEAVLEIVFGRQPIDQASDRL